MIEDSSGLLQFCQGFTTDNLAFVVLVPKHQVAGCRQQATVAVYHFKGHVLQEIVAIAGIGDGSIGHNFTIVIAPLGVFHAHRAKDALFAKLGKSHPTDPIHDDGHEVVARIAVVVLIARREIQAFLARQNLQHVRVGVGAFAPWPSSHSCY